MNKIDNYDSNSGKRFKRIFKNFSFLTFGKIGGDFFNFVLFIIITRQFGEKVIGQYSFAIGFTGFFAILSQFGLSDYAIKEISGNKNSFGNYFPKIFTLNLILSSLMWLVLLIFISFLSFSVETKLIVAIIGAYQITFMMIEIHVSAFIAHEQMHIAGGISVTTRLITAIGAVTIALFGGGIIATLAFLPFMSFVLLFGIRNLMRKRLGKIALLDSIYSLKATFKEVIPFGISDFLSQIYNRIDVVLIGFIIGETAAGIYNVGYRVIFFLLFIPHFASTTIFPLVPILYRESMVEFGKLYNKVLGMMVIIGLPVSAGLWLIAPKLINLIFGPVFSRSAVILKILAPIFLLKSFSYIMGIFLMSSNRQKYMASVSTIVSVLSIVIFPVFIYFWNIEGAAVAAVVLRFLLTILYMVKLKTIIGIPDVKIKFLVCLLGVSTFYIPLSFFPNLNIFVIIALSCLIYFGVILLFKDIRENEIRMILNLFDIGKDKIGIHSYL